MVTQLAASHNCQTSSTLKTCVADGRRRLILPSSTPTSPQEASFETLSTTATMISGLKLDKFGFNLDFFFFFCTISVGVQVVAEQQEILKIPKMGLSMSDKMGGGHPHNRSKMSFCDQVSIKTETDKWPEEALFLSILFKVQLKLRMGCLGWLLMCKFTSPAD